MRWWMLAGLQYSLAKTPGGATAYRHLQTRFGELRDIRGTSRFDACEEILNHLHGTVGDLSEKHIVEFGTGWVPALPLALTATGVNVQTYDVTPLVTDDLYQQTRDEVLGQLPRYAAAVDQNPQQMRQRLDPLLDVETFDEACDSVGMTYDGSADTANLSIADNSVDAVVSSLVLQCMPAESVDDVLAESFRILKPGGYAVHRIRMTDENAAHDSSKNHFDYLTYPRSKYERWYTHKLKYLNRLRASQFLSRMRKAGFNVYKSDRTVDKQSIDYIQSLPLDDLFAHLDAEDIATTNLTVILEKPVSWSGVRPDNRPDLHYLADDTSSASQSERSHTERPQSAMLSRR